MHFSSTWYYLVFLFKCIMTYIKWNLYVENADIKNTSRTEFLMTFTIKYQKKDIERLSEYYNCIYSSQMYENIWDDEEHERVCIVDFYIEECKTGDKYTASGERERQKRRLELLYQASEEREEKKAIEVLRKKGYIVSKHVINN